MSHPVFTSKLRRTLLWIFLGLTVGATLVLQGIDKALQNGVAPYGIVSYELAGSAANAEKIITSWDAQAQLYAAFSLGFDYFYILVYTITLALALLWAADGFSGLWRQIGIIMAWAMGLVGLADALENYFLWQMLAHIPTSLAAQGARGAVLLKFTLILLALLYLLIRLLRGLVSLAKT